jgi:hypothetical protein
MRSRICLCTLGRRPTALVLGVLMPLLFGLPVRLAFRFLGLLLTDQADLQQLVAQ